MGKNPYGGILKEKPKEQHLSTVPKLCPLYYNWIKSFLLLLISLHTPTENIKKWWIWGYWMSPMMYAQNAIVVNEFLGKSWRHVIS